MTVSTQTRKAGPYIGTDSTGPFSFSFKVFQPSDLLAVKADAFGTETTLIYLLDYSVSLNSDQNANPGGSITLESALPSGYKIIVSSQVPYLQETDLTNQGGFYPEIINDSLDKLTIQTQQLKVELDRAAKVPITSTINPDDLTAGILRLSSSASNIDIVANSVTNVNYVANDISSVNTVAGNIADINTVADISAEIDAIGDVTGEVTVVAGIADDVVAVAALNSEVFALGEISSDITTVSDNIAAVVTVANDLNEPVSEIDVVASNIGAVDAIGSDLAGNGFNYDMGSITSPAVGPDAADPGYIITVYNNLSDIETVAGSIGSVDTVAGNMTAISAVNANATNINAVASNSTNINSVAGNSANINAVAGNATNINAVAGNSTNINAVNANKTNIDAVAGNATNINAVVSNATNINTVAGISADVTAVADISTDVTTVADNITDVSNFAGIYYGPSASDPATRHDSTALQSGDLYFNTSTNQMRVYNGAAWNDITSSVSTPYQTLSGNGSTAAFTLNSAPGSLGSLEVYVSGVRQTPTTDYTVSGTTLTFTSAPPSGTANIFARWITTAAIGAPSDGTVTTAKLAAGFTLPVANGGTGATSAAAALSALGGLSTTAAASTYQTLSGMSGYLATSAIGTTVQAYDADLTAWAGKTAPTGDAVGTTDTQTLSAKTITGLKETKVAMAANNIDLSAGNYFTKTISTGTTLTVSNVPTTGTAASFILDLTNGGAGTITWWSGVKWAGGTAPTLTASGRDSLGFFTHDGGTTWTGLVLGKDIK